MGNCLPKFSKKENPSDTDGMGAKVRTHLLDAMSWFGKYILYIFIHIVTADQVCPSSNITWCCAGI